MQEILARIQETELLEEELHEVVDSKEEGEPLEGEGFQLEEGELTFRKLREMLLKTLRKSYQLLKGQNKLLK